MLLSTQLFDRIVGTASSTNPNQKPTVLPVGCRRATERREAARLAYGRRTQICRDRGKKAGVWATVMLQDISMKGVGYLSDEAMEIGETFVVKLTDREGETIRIRCKVSRCERGGFGNTAFLLGATFEHVIQQTIRLNEDEDDQPVWQDQTQTADDENLVATAATSDEAPAGVGPITRAVGMIRAAASGWMRKTDDFGSM